MANLNNENYHEFCVMQNTVSQRLEDFTILTPNAYAPPSSYFRDQNSQQEITVQLINLQGGSNDLELLAPVIPSAYIIKYLSYLELSKFINIGLNTINDPSDFKKYKSKQKKYHVGK